jgi:hypothetical protein
MFQVFCDGDWKVFYPLNEDNMYDDEIIQESPGDLLFRDCLYGKYLHSVKNGVDHWKYGSFLTEYIRILKK